MRTREEINEQQNLAASWTERGRTAYRSATYEDGVSDALAWVLGDTQIPPPVENGFLDEDEGAP